MSKAAAISPQPIEIGKIIKSENHIQYWVHVTNATESNACPSPQDCSFGTFIKIKPQLDENTTLIGVITDTILMDKDFLRAGPRLSANFDDMKIAFPDFIDERIKLVQILLIGYFDDDKPNHNFPDIAPHLGDGVIKMDDEEIREFHSINGSFQIGYYSSHMGLESKFLQPLFLRILGRLKNLFPESKSVIELIRSNLEYKLKLGGGL
jgi:hypothetical protein